MKMVLFFVVIVAGICECSLVEKKSCTFTLKYIVHVINDLPANSSIPLTIHCASGDDDLGYHFLKRGDDFHWEFCDDFFSRTLFFCHWWWGVNSKVFNVFDTDIKLQCNYEKCFWVARRDGIYFGGEHDATTGLVKKLVWDATEWYLSFYIVDFNYLNYLQNVIPNTSNSCQIVSSSFR